MTAIAVPAWVAVVVSEWDGAGLMSVARRGRTLSFTAMILCRRCKARSDADLLDERLGGGTPFLPPVTEMVPLDLVETRTFGSRVIHERYSQPRDWPD